MLAASWPCPSGDPVAFVMPWWPSMWSPGSQLQASCVASVLTAWARPLLKSDQVPEPS